MKKSSIILLLLTAFLALAALPALGDLNYLKNGYQYIEKIPIKVSSSINNKNRETENLLDNKKNTEWISWKENVIWEETYSQNRYFTGTAIDGANATTSTISNNTLSIPAIPANAPVRAWRQYQLFNTTTNNAELSTLKAGPYKLKIRYRGTVASANGQNRINLYLGNGDKSQQFEDQITVDVPTEWKEEEYEFTLKNDVNGAFCAVQPGTYPGVIEVDRAELSYKAPEGTIVDPFSLPITYDAYGADKFPYYNLGYMPQFEDGVLIAQNSDWYQFRVAEGLNLNANKNYRARLRIKGSTEGTLTLWCVNDGYSLKNFTIPTSDTSEVIVPLGYTGDSDLQNQQAAIQSRDGYSGKIEVKRFILEYEDNGQWIVDNEVDHHDLQNWPFKSIDEDKEEVEYIPALVEDGGKVVARITNPNYNNDIAFNGYKKVYQFRLANGFTLPKDTYTVKFRLKGDKPGEVINMIFGGSGHQGTFDITVKEGDYQDYEINHLALDGGTNNYWVVCRPKSSGYTGNFSVESIEFVSESTPSADWTITNDGTNAYGGDAQYREVKDGIIYSYPLPERRKVVLAVGDGAYTSQQYENKAGFELKNNYIYSVKYRIKGSDGSYPVRTVLANSNGWTTVGESGYNAMPTGEYADIKNNINVTQAAANGAVVLDLGYNVGSVDIENIRVIDNYDETILTHQSSSTPVANQPQDQTLSSADNFRTTQFCAAKGTINFDPNKKYKLDVDLKGSKEGLLYLKLGGMDYGSNRFMQTRTFGNGGWQELEFDTQLPHVNGDHNNFTGPVNNGNITLQFNESNTGNNYDGTVDVRSIRLYSHSGSNWDDWKDGYVIDWEIPEKTTQNLQYWNFSGQCNYEIQKDGTESILSVSKANSGTTYEFMVIDGAPNKKFEKGRSYKLKGLIRAPKGDTNSIKASLGTYSSFQDANITSVNTAWTDFDITFGPCPTDKSGFLMFTADGSGPIELKNVRLIANGYETVEFAADYTSANHSIALPTGLNITPQQHSYDALDNYDATNGLHLEPQGNATEIFGNLPLDIRRSYTATFDLNVTHGGKYKVTLGDGVDSQSQIIEANAGNNNIKVEFSAIAAQTGSLSITPMVYTQNLEVKNATFSYSTPAFDGGSLTGTDYFEVELTGPYTMDKEGKYIFHIGYAPNGDDLEEATPKEFVILGSNSKNGTYKRLGTYEVGEYKDGNAFISTVNSPLKIETNDIKYLRFMCTSNEGASTAICFPVKADGSNDLDNAYIGSMIRMTRFGMYKQSEMFATDKAAKNGVWDNYDHWALPAITRFQIEALGQKYAYPGATLKEMVGVGKSIEICGQLFDNDRYDTNQKIWHSTYWDTTLPFLKDLTLGTDNYQYIDYDTFTYPKDDDGNSNYDCIDILVPKLEDLGAVKKLNGKIDPNGIYQLVVSMAKGGGTCDVNDNLMTYRGESGDFTNRANGFPLEISYQGLKIDGNHDKTIVPIEASERVLTFRDVAEGDSVRFALKIEEGWNGVRIFCRENTGNLERRPGGTKETNTPGGDWSKRTVWAQNNAPGEKERGTRIMRLAGIRAYVELDKINIEIPEGRKRYDLLYNSRENLNTRGWEHNKGIIAKINNLTTHNGAAGDQNVGEFMVTDNYVHTWETVMKDYGAFFEEQGLSYPDFSMITNPFKDEDVVPSNGRKRDISKYNGQERQRTYTILHEVLALPGERVDLYPQSDIWQPNGFNYEEQFVRWYDYLTDTAPDYLYFFAEPKSVIKTQNAGFIGGKTLLDHGLRGKGTVASIFYDEQERKDFEEKLKTNSEATDDRYYYDNQYNTVRIMDNWVAADFSLSFNTNLAERLGKNTTTWENVGSAIQEPIINFRHLFHITSGSLFADRYMWTAEGNRHYAKSNRRYISSFAKKTFKIRLEQAMPVEENTKSAFYYRTKDNEYKRVRGYEIRTYKLGDKKSDEVGDAITLSGNTLQGEENEVPGMFGIDNSSKFNHIDSYVQTTTDPSKWLRNGHEFARAIACDGEKADEGRYLVRLYGKDEAGNIIGLQNEGKYDKPLVIAEYEVEFMGNEYASFLPEEIIDELDKEGGDLAHHTEKYLDTHYGATSDVKAVNFDKYTILNSESVIVDKGSAPVNFRRFGFFENVTGKSFKFSELGKADYVNYTLNSEVSRMKMPISWGDSNYGFGYMTKGDYNMFRLADHSLMTPYNDAASARHDETVIGEDKNGNVVTKTGVNGTYDRLFYNSGGTEKGLFYYVNAAADPGEMVKIDFDYLCPGSTIYVSAWVNEFNNGQPETANVIFNFYANVAKGEGADKTIIRQEQIHGFATGYVERGDYHEDQGLRYRNGQQGKWMHVYYSFVPDDSHADVVKAEGEYIDSYYLVLENNSISSEGADYAIDDIRAYVIAPRVEARQSNTLCERNDVDVDIEVELPLEALVQSLTGQENEDGIVSLQYSIVDKVKYDKVLEDIEAQHKTDNPPYEHTTDDYYNAFAEGVLHYRHDNVKTSDVSGKVDKPLSWGVIEFYMDYDNAKYKDAAGNYIKDKKITAKDGVTELVINGKTWTIGEYMDTYFKDVYEKCFVFKTRPVSKDEEGKENYNEIVKTHRDYYIVVDNIGTDHVFSSLFYDIDDEGNIKKDEAGNDMFLPGFDSTWLTMYNSDVYPDKKDDENYPLADWKDYDKELAKAYKIGSNCARMAPFKLKGSAQIVIDGVLHEADDNIACCENQRPVVQINLKTKEKDKENPDLAVKDEAPESENPYLDWWTGPFEDFAEETSDIIESGQVLSLWDILDDFRMTYPTAETWDVPCKDKYTEAKKAYLKKLCATTTVNDKGETVPIEPKLILHQSSYVFPQSKTILVDENGKKVASKEIFVTAIPPATPTEITEKNEETGEETTYVICTQPREVKITVSNTSPTLFNGFHEITYPEAIEDVPLRIGIKQLENVNTGVSGSELFIPLRNVNPATYDVKEFVPFGNDKVGIDNNIYLVETNDPNYRKLSDNDKLDAGAPSDTYDVETRVVGKITGLTVEFERDEKDKISFKKTPMAQVVFDAESSATQTKGDKLDNGITFREGYYYKFKFNFMEGETKMSEQEGYEMPCNGQTVFSIKVVPEYQKWTGGASLNWNNDDNWSRVSSEELLAADPTKLYDPESEKTDIDEMVKDADRFITDAATNPNKNTHSYAPLNFTKVIIPAGATYPQLAPRDHSYTYNYDASVKPVTVENGRLENNYKWVEKAPDAIPVANMTDADRYNTGDHKEASNTQPTVYINYDMAAIMYNNYDIYKDDHNVYCRPWYANACEQIHFDSNAEILNQQYLDYEKAWVDMEMAPHRWYTVASPLYGVVAGDMYLPAEKTGNTMAGRQMTELFRPIKYKTDLNDRFAPAVYQRGWDKGSETVYTIHDKSSGDSESVALASTWSHVYNDVTEEYAPGIGYSVKTDVTRLSKFQDGYTAEDKPTHVMFRFPKDDASYNYFEDGNPVEGEVNHRDLTRGNAGRLYSFEVPKGNDGNAMADKSAGDVILKKANTSEAGDKGKLFLVGNPFMAHLDMKKFFDGNTSLPRKFWIMSGDKEIAASIDNDGTLTVTNATADEVKRIAPMQGFFVQANNAVTEITVKFTPDMMAVEPYDTVSKSQLLKAPRPETSADGEDIIRVSTAESTAIIRLNAGAGKGYVASEDVEMIDDSNQQGIRRIYTVAGTMASAINQTPDADGVEVGLMAPTDSVTVVTFRGLALEDYMLYDTETGEKTQLYDGFELEMTGSVSGRYFLTSGVNTVEIEDASIRIMPVGHEVVVKAPAVCGALTVRVFDTLGREVAKSEGFEGETRIALDPGIYAVEAVGSDAGRRSAKLSIK